MPLFRRLLRDRFLLGMLVAVALASAYPELGRSGGWLQLDRWTPWGIFGVFLLYGLNIPMDELRSGLTKWRLHAVVQGTTFVAFPLAWLLLIRPLSPWLSPDLTLGFLFLCALPSTISSSVAFVGIARGNIPAAVFNTATSSLLGVVLTPAIVWIFQGGPAQSLSLTGAIREIALLLLLPMVLGQLLQRPLRAHLHRLRPASWGLDRVVVVILVLQAFSDSVADGLWTDHGAGLLFRTLLLTGLLLAFALWGTTQLSHLLGLAREERAVLVFCGSKKTLASGVPMASVIFAGHPSLGVILLPILFYHQLQLMAGTVLAQRYAEAAQADEPSPPQTQDGSPPDKA